MLEEETGKTYSLGADVAETWVSKFSKEIKKCPLKQATQTTCNGILNYNFPGKSVCPKETSFCDDANEWLF